MVKTSQIMNYEDHVIYEFLIDMFLKQFNVTREHLLNYKYQTTMPYKKSHISVQQSITKLVPNILIEFVSEFGNQRIVSIYALERKGDSKTLVTLTEEGFSDKKALDLNYKLFSFPVLNFSAKKKLKTRLYQINQLLSSKESGGNV